MYNFFDDEEEVGYDGGDSYWDEFDEGEFDEGQLPIGEQPDHGPLHVRDLSDIKPGAQLIAIYGDPYDGQIIDCQTINILGKPVQENDDYDEWFVEVNRDGFKCRISLADFGVVPYGYGQCGGLYSGLWNPTNYLLRLNRRQRLINWLRQLRPILTFFQLSTEEE